MQIGAANNAPPRKWTILQYSAADNNLYPWMQADVAEMERVGSDEFTNVLVQIDHGRGNNVGCQRLKLESDASLGGTPESIDSPVLANLGQVNMGGGDTLKDSLVWAMQNYPAEHYMLIISDHGNSWKGCCSDDSHMGWMNLPSLKSALVRATAETGKKLDVIGFDACLMANTEVAYQLKDQARYMVASEQTEGADGWPYTPILGPQALSAVQRSLRERVDLEPEELVRLIVDKSSQTPDVIRTLSAVDLEKMEGLKDAMVELRGALLDANVPQADLRAILKNCQKFFGYRDLGHWLELLRDDEKLGEDPEIQAGVARVMGEYQQVVIAEQHSPQCPNASGLTIHLTKPNDYYGYMALDFQKATDWVAIGNQTGPP